MAIIFDEVVGTVEGEPSSEKGGEQGEKRYEPGPQTVEQIAHYVRRLDQRTARLQAD